MRETSKTPNRLQNGQTKILALFCISNVNFFQLRKCDPCSLVFNPLWKIEKLFKLQKLQIFEVIKFGGQIYPLEHVFQLNFFVFKGYEHANCIMMVIIILICPRNFHAKLRFFVIPLIFQRQKLLKITIN